LTIASTETKKWILNIEFWVCAGRHQTQQQTLDAEIYPIKRNTIQARQQKKRSKIVQKWRHPLFEQRSNNSAAATAGVAILVSPMHHCTSNKEKTILCVRCMCIPSARAPSHPLALAPDKEFHQPLAVDALTPQLASIEDDQWNSLLRIHQLDGSFARYPSVFESSIS